MSLVVPNKAHSALGYIAAIDMKLKATQIRPPLSLGKISRSARTSAALASPAECGVTPQFDFSIGMAGRRDGEERPADQFWLRLGPLRVRLVFKRSYGMTQIMNKSSKRVIPKKRGRPATGNDPVRSLRMPDELMDRIDTWSANQEDRPSRAESIRRLVELGLRAKK
ncbi:hypothetical protein QA640_39035 [Bradyrhizobium sp. CB82]|uniref:hypothetical protein n=1 Tax=Bradyrhizobium sp. CB82 TaxID=3039159 RepID=UPI0024B0F2D8|nr:hypothetical protein [Bradyrhizobium sp. CB82]WFU40147.1 hypothetical protein QA640_39035 [Bradyrhizobium sp. CB82]